MNKKIFLWLIMLFIATYSVNAALTDDLISWYPSNSTGSYQDIIGGHNGGVSTVTFNSTGGPLGTGSYENKGTGQINISDNSSNVWAFSNTTDRTFVIWSKGFLSTDAGRIFADETTNSGRIDLRYEGATTQNIVVGFGSGQIETNGSTFINNWTMISIVIDVGGNISLYINDAQRNTTSVGSELQNGTLGTSLLDYPSGANDLNGSVSMMGVWNRTLQDTEITRLWSEGQGCQYPFSTCSTTNFTITAVNDYTNSTILIFNATITNSTYNQTFNTTSGTLTTTILSNTTSLFNITVRANNFFDNTTTNHNVSNNYQGRLTPYTNITAVYAFNSSLRISNFTINFSALNYTHTGTSSTTTGFIMIPFFNATYNVTISNSNHEGINYASNTTLLSSNPYLQNYTFNLFRLNTLNLEFRDQDTDALIDFETITFELISDVFSNNYSTSNGTILIELLEPGNYTSVYDSPSYTPRFYYFTVFNDSAQNLTLYMLNNSRANNITINVIKQDTLPVEQAVVKALFKDVSTNTFKTVEIGVTNFEGQTQMSLTKFIDFYRFIVEFEGQTVKTTNAEVILKDEITLQVIIGEESIQSLIDYESFEVSLIYDNTTNTYTFTFNDPSGLSTQMCLKVEQIGATYTVISNECVTSTSGSILSNFTPENDTTYKATAYYIDGNSEVGFLTQEINTPITEINLGIIGLWAQLILMLVMVGIAIVVKAALVPLFLALSLIMGRMVNLTQFDYGVLFGFGFVMLILTFVLARNIS